MVKEQKIELLRDFKPKTKNQQEYIRAIAENELVFCIGSAGTGKTHLSVAMGAKYLVDKKYDKLVITRPTIETDSANANSLGYLPGAIFEKMEPYLLPIFDELSYFLSKTTIRSFMRDGVIEILPLQFIRGRTLNNSYIIADELENGTMGQIKALCTRIGYNSKLIINGDIEQNDLNSKICPLETWIYDILGENNPDFPIIKLDDSDIIRSPIVRKILAKVRQYEEKL